MYKKIITRNALLYNIHQIFFPYTNLMLQVLFRHS